MKNLSIILLIFILPIAIYAYAKGNSGGNMIMGEKKPLSGQSAEVIEFSSPMCSECQKTKKIIEEIKNDYPSVSIKEVVVSGREGSKRENKSLIKNYNVTVVPTLIFLNKEGKLQKKLEDEFPKADIIEGFEEISKGK